MCLIDLNVFNFFFASAYKLTNRKSRVNGLLFFFIFLWYYFLYSFISIRFVIC